MLELEKAMYRDIVEVLNNLDTDDINEFAAGGVSPNDILKEVEDYIDKNTYVITQGREVLAIGGNDTKGAVWMLTSKKVKELTIKQKAYFIYLLQEHSNELLKEYKYLYNYVHVKNQSHIKLLTKLGAYWHKDSVITNETTGEQFMLFVIQRGLFDV